ncbi:Centrosomal protein B, partial [Araneus ventricosus]
DCPQKANPVGSSKSFTSCSKTIKSSGAYTQKAGSSTEYSTKYGPVTARRDSACSSKSMDSGMSRAASRTSTEGRLKSTGKKVPWK